MNCRDKFNAVLSFEPEAKIPKVEYGYWAGTIRSWFADGLPIVRDLPNDLLDGELIYASAPLTPASDGKNDHNVGTFFSLDHNATKFPLDMSPRLPKRVLEETDQYVVFCDRFGITQKTVKVGASVPMELEAPVRTAADWDAYKQHYEDDFHGRLPDDWETVAAILKQRDFPVRLGGNPFGFLGFPRHLMGTTGYLMGLYDQPELIKDINEFSLQFVMKYWSAILERLDVDCVFIFEDMSYKTGSLISIDLFNEFLAPYYVKLIDFLKQYGVTNILVDSDGLVGQLIPHWLKVGITGVFPMEAVNDLHELRRQYPRLQMMGGIDKRVLISGTRKQIDEELEKTASLIRSGGYIPHIDHSVSMDAKWENFVYYRNRLNDIIDNL